MTLKKQEIRILVPKISDEKRGSFFYDSSVAHGIREDGTAILLVAIGHIRIKIDGESYNNETKEKAVEKYSLTDEKLANLEKEGLLIWENNNWFEVIWTRDDKEHWESVDEPVKYYYDEAMELFNKCYNRSEPYLDAVPESINNGL